jgi:hypothetical protein
MSDFPLENLPAGTQHLYGSLFAVPFASIQVPEVSDENDAYQFSNPRMLTEQGQADLLDKRASAELRESIKIRTLLNPLVCRWVQDELGKMFPQLVGGDRRYRAIDFLIRKKEIVTDPRSAHLNADGQWEYKQVSAAEAYANVPCQIFSVSNDLDALALSWAENKSRINLTEGHEVAEVMKLRKFDASDEKILEILQQDEKWLAETDRLINELDVDTLTDLLESRMTRACALELASVEELDLRTKLRLKANESAQETYNRKIKRYQKQLETALDEREIAEGAVADAEFHKDEDGVEKATAQVKNAEKKVARTAKERDETTPVATTKDLKEAKAAITTEETGEEAPKMLRLPKVKLGAEYFDGLIASGGKCPEGTFEADEHDLRALKLVRMILKNNILANDDNFAATVAYFLESK